MLEEGCAYSGFAGITRRSVLPIASGESFCLTGVARDAGLVLPAPAPAPVPEGSSSSSGTQRLLPEPPGPRVGCRLPATSLSRTPGAEPGASAAGTAAVPAAAAVLPAVPALASPAALDPQPSPRSSPRHGGSPAACGSPSSSRALP